MLRFFPSSAYFARTAMSERVIAYTDESLKHRTLVLYEAGGVSGDMGTYLIRSLLSEGHINYEVVERIGGQFQTRRIVKEGPTGLIATTAAMHLHPENETRMLSVSVNDTPAQTREIIFAAAEAVSGTVACAQAVNVDLSRWHAFQGWLEGGERRVVVPFAPKLAQLVPPAAVRLRRDFPTFLTLVKTHALLHQATRERDSQEQIITSLEDYAVVRPLVADLLAEGIECTVPSTVRETVEAVIELTNGRLGFPIEMTALAKHLKLHKSTVSRRVEEAKDRGYLYNNEAKPGRPAQIIVGDPLPEDTEVLPTLEVLAEAVGRCCSVTCVSGGREAEASPTSTQTNLEVLEV